ncbi:outer membrane autotransporter protein [Pseudaminobacter salicylatoxidans]|uniref:Outer membrane autotransporter protein n=1 Tax=Pseudaminobacter salicylatoxidans TaxID=93369 RepID=A0A316C6H5_PSESE|nr:autotransporter domain-containing protein [Pseudaminobacter salicylatoxidans]PWJ84636.1 outer membrane autotransporter protein [Pseudaminobacter salicylatoxidans]
MIVASPGSLGTLATNVTGGSGGDGGNSPSFIGGGGGSGGTGLYLESSGVISVQVQGHVTGGDGGAGGNGGSFANSPQPADGDGGSGGAGIHIVGGAALTIDGAVSGGDGGTGGNAYNHGAAGAGGAGIIGQGLNIVIGSTGNVAGGRADGGAGARANAITFVGGLNTLTFGAATSNLIGNIGVTGGSSLTLEQSGIDTVVGNVIAGDGSLIKSGNAVITLTGSNIYTGTTTVSDGTLAGGAAGAFSAASGFTVLGGGVLDLGGFDQTVASLSGAGLVTNDGGADAILTVGGDNSSTVFSGSLKDGATNALGLTKIGTGTLTLSGDSLYSGRTTISAGTLEIAGPGAGSPDSDYLVDAGAALEIADAVVAEIGSLADGALGGGKVTIGATSDMTMLSVGKTGATTTFSGQIGGTGSLVVVDGSLTLTGASAIGGDLIVEEDATVAIVGSSASFSTGVSGLASAGVLGTLNISGGADFDTDLLFIGGDLIADGLGTTVTVTDGPTFIGIANTAATLTISGGAIFESEGGAIIENPIVGASAVVTGAGSKWNVSNGLAVGNAIAGGTGLLTISAGGTVNVTGDTFIAADTASTGLDASSVAVTDRNSSLATVGLEIGAQIDKAGELSVTDAGIVTATGPVTIGALGILNIGGGATAGTFVAPSIQNDGRIIADFTDTATLAANIGGIGSFAKSGAGTLILNGNSAGFSGAATVHGGVLSVNGTLGGTMTVLAGGALGGSGTVGAGAGSLVTVASGGRLAPGNSIGTLTVAGNLLLHPGSIYEVEIAGNGGSDRVAASGTATVTGSHVAVIALDPETSYRTGQTYTILTAAGGVSGSFADALTQSAFLDLQLDGQANAVDLTIKVKDLTPDPLFGSVAETPNQIATAGGLDELRQSGPQLALYNALLMLDARQARAAFDRLSGEIHASARGVLLDDSRFLRDAVTDRLRAAFEGVGAATLPVMAYGENGPQLAPAGTERLAAWGNAFGSWGKADGDGNAAGLDHDTGGLLMGVDGLAFETWRLGIVAGYSHAGFDASERAASGSSDNYHLGAYAGTSWGKLGFRSGLAYTWHDVETARSVALPGFADRLSADYDAGSFQAFGELGYRIDTQAVSFEPFASLAYVKLRTAAFSEDGGAAALYGASQTTDATFTTLGIRAQADVALGAVPATARAMLGLRHAFGAVTPEAGLAFAGGNAFTIAGTPIARNAAVIEAGLDIAVAPSATLGLSYRGQLASRTSDNGFKVDLNVRF